MIQNCPRKLLDFLEDRMSSEEKKDIEGHIAQCVRCKEELEQLRRTVELLDKLPLVSPPTNLWLEVERKIDDGELEKKGGGLPGIRSVITVAALLLLVLVGSILFSQYSSPDVRLVELSAQTDLLEETALELYSQNSNGRLDLDLTTTSVAEAYQWIVNQTSLQPSLAIYSPQEQNYVLHGVKLIRFGEAKAVCIVYEIDSRPVTLLVIPASSVPKAPSRSLLSKRIGYKYDPLRRAKLLVWSQRKESYALVSDLPGFGQNACFICHATPARRELIRNMRLEPPTGKVIRTF